MKSSESAKCAAAVIVYLLIKKKKLFKKANKRKVWVRDWILRRSELGAFKCLIMELKTEDRSAYENFIRMSYNDFKYLLELVTPIISKQNTTFRESISPSERLYLTLRFLATGDSYQSLSYLFRIPVCSISRIVPECCEALFRCLKGNFLKVPDTSEEWLSISEEFEKKWHFPHCVGALDGKHVVIICPNHSGSYYFNYKGTHSVVLLALVDANYKFLYVDIGCNGRISDGGVFNNCNLSKALSTNSINLPPAKSLEGRELPVPYLVVADDAFALKPYLMKPLPFKNQPVADRVFNYRLSRARNTVENVFGIISSRFRVLRKPIHLHPEKVVKIVSAICALHNFLISRNKSAEIYAPRGTFDEYTDSTVEKGSWREEGMPEASMLRINDAHHNYSQEAKTIRNEIKDFFLTTPGEVPWQYCRI